MDVVASETRRVASRPTLTPRRAVLCCVALALTLTTARRTSPSPILIPFLASKHDAPPFPFRIVLPLLHFAFYYLSTHSLSTTTITLTHLLTATRQLGLKTCHRVGHTVVLWCSPLRTIAFVVPSSQPSRCVVSCLAARLRTSSLSLLSSSLSLAPSLPSTNSFLLPSASHTVFFFVPSRTGCQHACSLPALARLAPTTANALLAPSLTSSHHTPSLHPMLPPTPSPRRRPLQRPRPRTHVAEMIAYPHPTTEKIVHQQDIKSMHKTDMVGR